MLSYEIDVLSIFRLPGTREYMLRHYLQNCFPIKSNTLKVKMHVDYFPSMRLLLTFNKLVLNYWYLLSVPYTPIKFNFANIASWSYYISQNYTYFLGKSTVSDYFTLPHSTRTLLRQSLVIGLSPNF